MDSTDSRPCHPLLLPEILFQLGPHLAQHDVLACVLVCRAWYQGLLPFLFQRVVLPRRSKFPLAGSVQGSLGSAHYEPTSSYPSLSKKRKIASRPMVESLNRFGSFIRTLICEDAASPLLRTITPNCLGLETLILGTGSGLTTFEAHTGSRSKIGAQQSLVASTLIRLLQLNKNTLRRLELTPYRNFMLPSAPTTGASFVIDEYDFAALTMGQTRQSLNSSRWSQREPALRSRDVLEAIMDLGNLEHLVVDHLGLRNATDLSEFFEFCGQLTSLELYNVAIVDSLPFHLRQPALLEYTAMRSESPESLDTSFDSQGAETIVLPGCTNCQMETMDSEDGNAINMTFNKLRFVSLVNLWMPIHDQFLFLVQCPSLEHITWIRQGHEMPLGALAYHHHVRYHHLHAVCSSLKVTHPESMPTPLMLSSEPRAATPPPSHAFRTLTSLDISNNTLQDADIATAVRELRNVLRRFYARDSRHLGELTIQNLTESTQALGYQSRCPYAFVPKGYIEQLEVLDITDCPSVTSKMVLRILQTCKALRCLSADQINTLDLLPIEENSTVMEEEKEQTPQGNHQDRSDLRSEHTYPNQDLMTSVDHSQPCYPPLEMPKSQRGFDYQQASSSLCDLRWNTSMTEHQKETDPKTAHGPLLSVRPANTLSSRKTDSNIATENEPSSPPSGEKEFEGMIPWACEETLEELKVTFVGRLQYFILQRRHQHRMQQQRQQQQQQQQRQRSNLAPHQQSSRESPDPLDSVFPYSDRAMQQFVYRQLSRLRRLRVLSIGYNGSSVKTHTQGEGLIPSAVELSLQSGLSMLGALEELQEFGFLRMDHKLTIGELRWMLQCWPRLEVLCGVFHPTDKNRDALMERFLLSTKPSIRLRRKLKNRQGYLKLDDML